MPSVIFQTSVQASCVITTTRDVLLLCLQLKSALGSRIKPWMLFPAHFLPDLQPIAGDIWRCSGFFWSLTD